MDDNPLDLFGYRSPHIISFGATSEETELALNKRHQTVSARFKELRDDGYIDYLRDASGIIVERNTVSGCGAKVHICTEKGRNAVLLGLPIRRAKVSDPTRGFHRGDSASDAAFRKGDRGMLRLEVLIYINSRT